jgi:hypothetical protein
MKANSVSPDGGRVLLQVQGNTVTIQGEIDQQSPKDFLAPFFDEIHKAADQENLHELQVDISGLVFLNSSAVKELIGWVLRRNRLPPGKKYTLEFVYDSSILWQRVTMPTICQLDPKFVILSDRGKPPQQRL